MRCGMDISFLSESFEEKEIGLRVLTEIVLERILI